MYVIGFDTTDDLTDTKSTSDGTNGVCTEPCLESTRITCMF